MNEYVSSSLNDQVKFEKNVGERWRIMYVYSCLYIACYVQLLLLYLATSEYPGSRQRITVGCSSRRYRYSRSMRAGGISCWIRTGDLRSRHVIWVWYDMTSTRVSKLDFRTARTTRLSLRLETLGQKSSSIPKSGEIETFPWMERCCA